jgi:malonyl CoA-acyl carrier protein transacylase
VSSRRARAALFCPGRGSYTEKTLRSIHAGDAGHPLARRAEELRAAAGLESLAALDQAPRFDPGRHLLPVNAAALIWLVTLIDAERAAAEHELVCVGGNSMGWYTALAVSGALDFEDGFALVQTMARLQQEEAARSGGGQVLYPLVGDAWRAEPERARAVEAALESARGEAFRSIELGGYAVLAGSEAGIAHLLAALPRVKLGSTPYPFRLVQHGPYHTPLAAPVAARARSELSGLSFRRPRVALVDGLGRLHTPWAADPEELRAYTLGTQIVEPYRFDRSVRVAQRELAPELVVLPGPGNTLGGIFGQIACAERWRGIATKAEFEAVQASDDPLVASMRR